MTNGDALLTAHDREAHLFIVIDRNNKLILHSGSRYIGDVIGPDDETLVLLRAAILSTVRTDSIELPNGTVEKVKSFDAIQVKHKQTFFNPYCIYVAPIGMLPERIARKLNN